MSFQIGVKPKDVAAAKVVQQLQDAIVKAFMRRRKVSKVKQADVARLLEVDRAQISRWLKGPSDMSLKSIGHLLWALDAQLRVDVELRNDHHFQEENVRSNATFNNRGIETFQHSLVGNAKLSSNPANANTATKVDGMQQVAL